MKRISSVTLAVCVVLLAAPVLAVQVDLYVDSAPNPVDVGAYGTWEAGAFPAAANGSFVNMANGSFPNSKNFAATDAIVLPGGGGRQLSWVFWIPGETFASMVEDNGIRFEVRSFFDWDGSEYDLYGWAPVNITDVDLDNDQTIDGVIGTFGDAFAPGGPYPTVAELEAAMYQWQTYWTGQVRVRSSDQVSWDDDSVQVFSLQANLVPTPLAAPAGLALLALGVMARRTRR